MAATTAHIPADRDPTNQGSSNAEEDRITPHLSGRALARLANPGLLLVSQGRDGVTNVMTTGCGTVGRMWGMATFTVIVRHPRYTFGRLEESDSVTVNVPSPGLCDAVAFCGKHSGRDCDKVAECDLTAERSRMVSTPGIVECPVTYECRILPIDVIKGGLDPKLTDRAYPGEDLFRPYYGQILAAQAVERLGEGTEWDGQSTAPPHLGLARLR